MCKHLREERWLKLFPSLLGWRLAIEAKLFALLGGLALAFSLGLNKVFVEGDLALFIFQISH